MPTYQYACTAPECGNQFDLVQSFTDPAASTCPVCGGPVRKVFSAVGVVFKGSGFYQTDSRSSSSSKPDSKSDKADTAATKSETKTDAGASSGGGGESKGTSEAKPAASTGGDGTKVA
jgi:putative FmdB family regulatory protein